MALKLKYTDEHGILHINMSPSSSPIVEEPPKTDITYPKFDTINHRFGNYDIFGGKYDVDSGVKEGGDSHASAQRSLFRSRYNSIEEELANTPYAFTERRSPVLDISIASRPRRTETSPSRDIEDDRFFNRSVNVKFEDGLFGPSVDFASKSSVKSSDEEEVPAFTVTQLIHAQDRYFDLSGKQTSLTVLSDIPVKVKDYNSPRNNKSDTKTVTDSSRVERQSAPSSARERTLSARSDQDEAFKVLSAEQVVRVVQPAESVATKPATSATKKKNESSFAILTETPISSRPSSPRSLPVETRRVSPFRGHGFREETSRHTTPKSSTNNSRASSPSRRRTYSLSRLENMAATALPPLPIHTLSRPHSPRNFVKQNIEEVRELSELNREKHEAEAEIKRKEEEDALLIEMGLLDKNTKSSKSVVTSRNTSRSNSPTKINLRSRSNSPSAILHFENINAGNKDFINSDDGISKPVTHRSRLRSVSRSQPQSNNGSPKHSKIPKRQNSVSPPRNDDGKITISDHQSSDTNLNKNQRFISSSTSSINDSGIRIGGTVKKKAISKSSQHLSISPSNIRGKPPISPGRGGPPPVNKAINAKRLSPIVGTPNKSPIENTKPGSARTPTKTSITSYKKPAKTVGNTPSTSRQTSRAVSPDKKNISSKNNINLKPKPPTKTITRTPSTKNTQKPTVPNKPDPTKKPMNRTNSMKSLVRTPSSKTLNDKPPTLKRNESRKNLMDRAKSNTKINEAGKQKESEKIKENKNDLPLSAKKKDTSAALSDTQKQDLFATVSDEKLKQDNETQYDSITNEKGELVILTKKNIVSMTTAAITAQPLEVVTTVTNQLPAALEKAREKGIFERHSSKDSIAPKEDAKIDTETNIIDEKKNTTKANGTKSSYSDDIKLKLLQPPYNNPQVERVKQKIDDILKAPEVSTESILGSGATEIKETKNTLKSLANRAKNDIKEKKEETVKKFTDIKNEIEKKSEDAEKEAAKISEEIRSEAIKIVDSIITPVEEPRKIEIPEKTKEETKIDIEPIVMIVNEKKKTDEIVEKVNETLVKGEPEVEVQSSNVSTPIKSDLADAKLKKMADGNGSDPSIQSNGGFPQSTSTTPKPPARTKKLDPNALDNKIEENKPPEAGDDHKKQNICKRLMGKCAQKTKCCGCCGNPEPDDDDITIKPAAPIEGKTGMSKWSCCKKKDDAVEDRIMKDVKKAPERLNTIEFENETKGKTKRTLSDIFCGCCKRRHRIGDSASLVPGGQGCFGRRPDSEIAERRDSILSDRPPRTCCNNRLCNWMWGACRRRSDNSLSRRPSIFSKNKSLSPTLPPEDTRSKLDPSLIEHTSVIRGAIPVLPISLAYFCLVCNVLVPGLGSILSGLFCLCFGIPRFGIHDGLKHRIGSLVINLLVGCGQLFTVLFCLVGWGWSIWWGVIMVRVSKKYRKLAAEAAAEEEQAPPVTTNNHHSRA